MAKEQSEDEQFQVQVTYGSFKSYYGAQRFVDEVAMKQPMTIASSIVIQSSNG